MNPFVRKTSLNRRSFLRGTGIALSLPLLDAMLPACATALERKNFNTNPMRFIAMHYGLGFHAPFFFPEQTGENYKPSLYLEEIADFKNNCTVFSGVSHPEQRGANGHTSEMTWLTGGKHPGLPGFKNTISLDQMMAEQIGVHTRFPFLTLNVSGSDSLSWTANGVNLPAQSSPSKLFQQLFMEGNPDQINQKFVQLERGKSILDAVKDQANGLNKKLGPVDQQKMDQYLTSIRELEIRLKQSQEWAKKPKPKVDYKTPTDIKDRTEIIAKTRLMHDLMHLALKTDSTRIITYRAGGMNAVPKIEGVSNDWHNLSHHGKDDEKIDELKLIEAAEFAELNRFFGLLNSSQEQGASLLDNSVILAGSNLGNASSHSTLNMPVLLAGGGFKHGKHIQKDLKENTPLCNLYVQIAQRMGLETDAFGSSTSESITDFETKW